ncbi:MAG: hypothetical protein OXL41_06765 [Nitrospinae bacterium]|nr:hypothetical protein [Nitrospinota bacterium]
MESSIWARVKKVVAMFLAGTTRPSPEERGRTRSNSPSPGDFDTLYESVNPLTSFRFVYRGEEKGAGGAKDGAEMKIILFSIKFDKFTGFFDKFLKFYALGNDCNQKGYLINLSAYHSDSAPKKVFRLPRICPQQPAFPPAPHHADKPSLLGRQTLALTRV